MNLGAPLVKYKIIKPNGDAIMTAIFSRRKIMNTTLGGIVATLSHSVTRASLPIPQPAPLDEFVKNNGQLIFTGRFNRVVAITRELDGKLYDPAAEIYPNELQIYEFSKIDKPGAIFFEITNADLKLVNIKNVDLKYIKNCTLDLLYVYGFDISGSDDIRARYREMVGSEIILFLTPQINYGKNSKKFPEPFFHQSSAGGLVHPIYINSLDHVTAVARGAGYIEVSRGFCNKYR